MKGTLHPSSLEVRLPKEKPKRDGFVGIRDREGQTEFCLPKGFDKFEEDELTGLFFKLYKTFEVRRSLLESSQRETEELYDSGLQTKRGISYLTESQEPTALYSKFPSFESLAKKYDLPQIYSIISLRKNTEEINYSEIHKYLDKAVFLDDHTPFVDEMRLTTNAVSKGLTSIVSLYCYLYTEVYRNIDGLAGIPNGIVDAAQLFKERNLVPSSSLFAEEDTHYETIEAVKSEFESIDRGKKYKDSTYVEFRNTVEDFLYGSIRPENNGIYWGTERFFRVWEDMCTYFMYTSDKRSTGDKPVFVDSARLSNGQTHGGTSVYKSDNFNAPLYFSTDHGKRYIRPDYISTQPSRSPSDLRQEILTFEDISATSIKVKGTRDRQISVRCVEEIKKKMSFSNMKEYESWSVRLFGTSPNAIDRAKSISERVISTLKDESTWKSHSYIIDVKYKTKDKYKKGDYQSIQKEEIRKQLLYEYCLQEGSEVDNLSSCLVLPEYRKDDETYKDVDKKSEYIRDNDVYIMTVDFEEVQELYNKIDNGRS
ncbi:hypothetical protein [Salinibacter ruber]|uniref:hypothetical protein n=1 Tax=Salinibacter ruber TaxID=146919 RepID=UPI0021693BB6|nr:hypothetical protein [Salinibacter ruber]MCS4053176.1 hypothetical protein [Salinibacter ruber]